MTYTGLLNYSAIIRNIVTIITLVIGCVVAIKGLSTWKAQISGQYSHKLARKILLNFYKYKEYLYNLRHPAVWTFEYPSFTSEQLQQLSHGEKQYKELEYAYQKRWNKISNLKPTLQELVLESQVAFDNVVREIYNKIFTIEVTIQRAIATYIGSLNPATETTEYDHDVVFDKLDNTDKLRNQIESSIKELEEYLKPKIKCQ